MKPLRSNVLLVVFLMISLPFIGIGQAKDKKKTVELLCHTWKVNTAKNPQKPDCFPSDADSSIHFITNGYIIFSERKGAEGVWNYDALRNSLYIIINGTLWKYQLRSLTDTELIVESTNSKNVTAFYLIRP